MKKHLFILAIILFTTLSFCSAQVTFQKAIGSNRVDIGKAVRQTSDVGYIIAGKINYSSIYLLDNKAYLIRTNSNGDLLWTKTFISPLGSGGLSIVVSDAQQTNYGGYVLLGAMSFKGQKTFLINSQVGLKELSSSGLHITVFPNPASTEIKIRSKVNINELTITDMYGKQFYHTGVLIPTT